MNITYENTVLMVKNMAKSKQFYTELMGQKVSLDSDGTLIFESGLSLNRCIKNPTLQD